MNGNRDVAKIEETSKYHITYFPLEQKYGVWDEHYTLIKEWFDTREGAQEWIDSIKLETNNE